MLAGRKVKLAALAAGMALLAGCGIHPGSAVVVGSESISHEKVDAVADAMCEGQLAQARARGQLPQALGMRGAREVAVQLLLDSELSRQFGEHEGVTPDQQRLSQAIAQTDAGTAALPEKEREVFRQALRRYVEGQLMLIEVGRKALGGNPSDDQAIAEGMRLRARWARSVDVEVDPRYGSVQGGTFQRGGTALSVPASDSAKAADSQQPDASYVNTLPTAQQCR